MRPRPTVVGIPRIRVALLLTILLAVLTTACTSSAEKGRPDAAAVKTEMDAEAASLLPDLMEAFGGEVDGMKAMFWERGGFGIWDYKASGTVIGLPGTDDQALTAGTRTLEKHGFTVKTDGEKSFRAIKGSISVLVQSASIENVKGIDSLYLIIMSTHPVDEDDDFAKNAPAEDYLAFLDQDSPSRSATSPGSGDDAS